MNLKIKYIDYEIKIEDGYINVIEIENKSYFYRIVSSLCLLENGTLVDDINFYEINDIEINMCNKLNIIIDYFNIDFDNKKYSNGILKLLGESIDEKDRDKLAKAYNKMQDLVQRFTKEIDIDISINENVSFDNLLKLFKFNINKKEKILENIFTMLDIEKTLKCSKVIIFVNLKQYLTNDELHELYKYAIYNNIYIILIDSQAYGIPLELEKKFIIDAELEEYVI